jgi:large subunit ribosomal protein L10
MAVTRAKKVEQVEKLSKDLKGVNNLIVATFEKLTVEKDFELRKSVRSAGGRYAVVKNTLAERATKGTEIEGALKDLKGVTSIAYTTGDPVALAKALTKYAKDNPEFKFKTGMVEGRALTVRELETLAAMPSKEEIYAKLLFLINAPAQRLVTVMNAVGRDVAVVLSQGVEKKKFKEAEA